MNNIRPTAHTAPITVLLALLLMLTITACEEEKKVETRINSTVEDSLRKVIHQRDNEVNDIIATLNEIQEGFRLISEAEGRVTLAESGEGMERTDKIRRDIRFIQSRMEENRNLIGKLRKQQRESSFRSEELKQTIENIAAQLQEKDKELKRMRQTLADKDIHIAELDKTIDKLSDNVENLKAETTTKTQVIENQDKQMHTAWYVFGTKKELRNQNILTKEGVLRQNFNKNYFTQIDIRVDREIKLYSSYAKVLTNHPAGTYSLTKDANGQYIFRALNPSQFWQTGRYLVILVK